MESVLTFHSSPLRAPQPPERQGCRLFPPREGAMSPSSWIRPARLISIVRAFGPAGATSADVLRWLRARYAPYNKGGWIGARYHRQALSFGLGKQVPSISSVLFARNSPSPTQK